MVLKETPTPFEKLNSLFCKLDSEIRHLPDALWENNIDNFPSKKGYVFIDCPVDGRYTLHIVTGGDGTGRNGETECLFYLFDASQVCDYFQNPKNIAYIEEKIKTLQNS